MICQRCSWALRAIRTKVATKIESTGTHNATRFTISRTQSRSISLLTPRRPAIPLQHTSSRATSAPSLLPASSSLPTTSETLDILPKISSHLALAATQVRNGPRDTFKPSHFVRKRRHGFLARIRTRTGRNIIKRRRAKKRTTYSH